MRSEAALAAQCLTATSASPGVLGGECDGGDGAVELLRGLRRELRFLFVLRGLPVKVALFQWRAHRLALCLGDEFSLVSATRPGDLAKLITLARSRRSVAELGTGTAWTAISLALADGKREVVSYDPINRCTRDVYLRLVGLSVRGRVALITEPGVDGASGRRGVELLYVDSSHGREQTVEEIRAWRSALADGATVVLDDFTHPSYPGPREAVKQLGLDGETQGNLFVHRTAAGAHEQPSPARPDIAGFLHELVPRTRRVARRTGRLIGEIRWAIEDRRIDAEQRRGELGPAHLGWRGNSPAENRQRWSSYDWAASGEEWTASAEWKQSLVEDVLVRWIPSGAAVLEIGPGAGRWSEALAQRALRLTLVDVSERPLELCRERFGEGGRVQYVLSSGSDLPGVPDASIDAVWSFDVFVHIAPRDQARYLAEIARVLAPGGTAVIHHSDGRDRGELPSRHGWRAPMSRELFAKLAARAGLRVERQLDSWGPDGRYGLSSYADVITVCRG